MVRLGGHGPAKYLTGSRLASSDGRGWKGLVAERWRHSEGDLGEVQLRDTEVIVMLRGRLRVRRRGDGRLEDHFAVPGTIWLCPAGVTEDMIRLYGEVEESLHLHLPAAPLAETALRELDVDPDRIHLHYEGGLRDPLIERIARRVHAEMTTAAPAGKVLVDSLAAALGVHLLRRYSNLASASNPLPSVRGALDARRLKRVMEFVDNHLGDDLTIEALANEACLSAFHFARAFKAATGSPPHEYVMQRRVGFAKELVEEGQLPLAAIAEICGFSSQSHLTRWFKQTLGLTPGAYRAR